MGTADAIVVLEGSPARIALALDVFAAGAADLIVYPGRSEWSGRILLRQAAARNLDPPLLVPDDSATESTWEEAVNTRALLAARPEIRSIILATSDYHSFRTRWSFERALPPSIRITSVSVPSSYWSPERVRDQLAAADRAARPIRSGPVRLFREEQIKFLGYFVLYGWRVLPQLLRL